MCCTMCMRMLSHDLQLRKHACSISLRQHACSVALSPQMHTMLIHAQPSNCRGYSAVLLLWLLSSRVVACLAVVGQVEKDADLFSIAGQVEKMLFDAFDPNFKHESWSWKVSELLSKGGHH